MDPNLNRNALKVYVFEGVWVQVVATYKRVMLHVPRIKKTLCQTVSVKVLYKQQQKPALHH